METKPVKNMVQISNLKVSDSQSAEKLGKTTKKENIDKTQHPAGAEIQSRGGYDVSLSTQAKELADAHKKAYEIAQKTPDIREDRVAELRQQIKEGKYKIDPEKIVEGMVKEALQDRLAQRLHEEA